LRQTTKGDGEAEKERAGVLGAEEAVVVGLGEAGVIGLREGGTLRAGDSAVCNTHSQAQTQIAGKKGKERGRMQLFRCINCLIV
jgi:hypothetical protein